MFSPSVTTRNRYAQPIPLNHSFAVSAYASLMLQGAAAVLSNGVMDLGQMYRMIEAHRVTGICLVPAALSLILKYSQDRFAGCAEKLRYLRMGGAKPIEGDARRAHALMPDTRILNVYGATETGTVFGAELGPDGFDPACVGRSVGELTLKFVDAEGREVGVSREAPGYVAIRSARNMRGYFGNPALTKSALSADGFVLTCDLGYLGADGKLHLVGREGGVLCVGGFMVSLDELERIARSMDGVGDCACVAVEDELLDQVPVMFYAAADGCGVEPGELRAFLEAKLERFKLPRRIERLERIPKLYNGKTDVRALRGDLRDIAVDRESQAAGERVVDVLLGAGEVEVFAEDVDDLVGGFDGDRLGGAVEGELDDFGHGGYSWGWTPSPQTGQAGLRLAWTGLKSASRPS